MKHVKMLGLAAAAAAALTAFVGASTASATVLCSEPGTGSGTTCPAGKAYPASTPIHAVNQGIIRLTTEFLTVECEESTIQGSTNNEGGASETVTIANSTWNLLFCNCEVSVIKDGSLEVHWISNTSNGTLTSSGAEITFQCTVPLIGKVHCIIVTSSTDLGTLTGGAPAEIDIPSANIPRLTTSSFCDKTANLDASYRVTGPSPLYVTGHT